MKSTPRPYIALFAAVMLPACSAHAAPQQQAAAVPVILARAGSVAAQSLYSGPATVVAAHTYKLAFEIPGRIASVQYDVGDRVRAGAVLASIADADYRAQLNAAAAHAASAQAQARKAFAGSRPQEKAAAHDAVRNARAQLDSAQAGAVLARANADRARGLFAQGAISAQAQDGAIAAERDALARVDAARAGVTAAANQAALVDLGARTEDRSAALAEAHAAGASSELAQITLNKTALRAPADAYVLARSVEPGDQASPGLTVFTLTDAATPDVVVNVPETKAAAIYNGMTAAVTSGERRYDMRVVRLEPQADSATRTVQVRLHGSDFSLKPGAVVNAEIGRRETAGASVPIGAILTAADGSTSLAVYDSAAKTLAHRTVHVRRALGERVVVAGVRPGELIVTGGQYQARPGQDVTIVSQEK